MKVLVVDDDRTNRMVLQAMLSKEGYGVVTAENGRLLLAAVLYDDADDSHENKEYTLKALLLWP